MLIERLQAQSGVSKARLLALSRTASKRYKVYNIPKRGGGVRQISHPSRTLKAIQRWISNALLCDLPVHQAATAYRRGKSIRANALAHAESKYTLRMDFQNFFPSFSSKNIQDFLRERNGKFSLPLSTDDLKFVGSIVTRNAALTIGAPSSPILTNAMMYDFDREIYSLADQEGLVYTRYADDLFISSDDPRVLTPIGNRVLLVSKSYPYARLRINHQKTAYLSRRYRRSITGLVVTPNGGVSIGRDRKREIKALIHQFTMETLPLDKVGRARGLVAFAMDSDPEFYASLCRKYGKEKIDGLLDRRP